MGDRVGEWAVSGVLFGDDFCSLINYSLVD